MYYFYKQALSYHTLVMWEYNKATLIVYMEDVQQSQYHLLYVRCYMLSIVTWGETSVKTGILPTLLVKQQEQ